jgi:acyl-CoA synthetase (AMP-forming)/AMP-acid ligase II
LTEENELARSGEIGEICVRGSSLALGYFNNLEQTNKVFVQNPLNNSYPETIYRTGDLARWNDRGELLFEGRRDFQIKHQGYRIELAEIEHAILGAGLVLNACVLYAPQEKQIVLIYEAESMLEAGKLRAQLTKYLPKYMLPTKLIQVASMPMNPNGKIDRQLLSETHAL